MVEEEQRWIGSALVAVAAAAGVAAAALAERGLKAVLVAANLRCPTYQTWAMLAAGVG